MKTRDVKSIQRCYEQFGQIQLWVDNKGRLFTFGADTPRFKVFANQEVVLMPASELKKLYTKLWEQRHLMQVA